MKILIILISVILMSFTLVSIVLSIFNAETNKERLAILLMITEPADAVGYLFYIGLFGLIAGLLLF
ncbi:hypothetical protein [Ureibacillus sinduriensis]|uniref:Uncharacterized protein n=1 Tax=Ureibacillus sinduriensis BLB-1 = JCM 15800 TaxID=1384057 RepID=A0A0A3HXZ1_9BACL|nr:hypothetical protein [Ureibacillus sinduriensis]KGR77476.1 hypothetical protein CD33_03010 [Ureibacillus sinduriensis BLB-1 = JCM 15800]